MAQETSSFAEYRVLKQKAVDLLGQAESWLGDATSACGCDDTGAFLREIIQRLEQERFNLVVVGEFSSGKSYFLNVLLDKIRTVETRNGRTKIAGALPVKVSPTTSTITVIRHGSVEGARVFYRSGRYIDVPTERVSEYLAKAEHAEHWTETLGIGKLLGTRRPASDVERVEISWESPWLRNGISIVDTPGVGSVVREHAKITSSYIPQADAILFMFVAQPPINHEARLFLSQCAFHRDRFFFVQTMKDREYDWDERSTWTPRVENGETAYDVASRQNAATLADTLGFEPRVFGISSLWAAWRKQRWMAPEPDRSGFPELLTALEEFLVQQRGVANIRHQLSQASRVLQSATSRLDVACTQAGKSLEELEQQLRVQEPIVRKIQAQSERLRALLEDDLQGLVDGLAGGEARVYEYLEGRVCSRIRQMPVRQMRDAATIIPYHLQQALNAWVAAESRETIRPRFRELRRKLRENSQELQSCMACLADSAGSLSGSLAQAASGLAGADLFHVPLPDPEEVGGRMEVVVADALIDNLGWLGRTALSIPIIGRLAEAILAEQIEAARREIEQEMQRALRDVARQLVNSHSQFLQDETASSRKQIQQATDALIEIYNGSLERMRMDVATVRETGETHQRQLISLRDQGIALVRDCERLLKQSTVPGATAENVLPVG